METDNSIDSIASGADVVPVFAFDQARQSLSWKECFLCPELRISRECFLRVGSPSL